MFSFGITSDNHSIRYSSRQSHHHRANPQQKLIIFIRDKQKKKMLPLRRGNVFFSMRYKSLRMYALRHWFEMGKV
jgi:hypothetical protein